MARQCPARVRVCRLFCSLAVIEHSGVRPSSSFSRVSPQPPARVQTQCSVTAPGPESEGDSSLGEGRTRHRHLVLGDLENLCLRNRRGRMLIPHIHLLASIGSGREAGTAGQGGCPPPGHSAQQLPGSDSPSSIPLEAGLIIERWKSLLSAAIENASGCWKGQREQWGPGFGTQPTRDKNARVITPDPRGWNALRRDNIFLCNHGC